MKVLITGAAGMLGTALCPSLIDEGHKVIKTDRHGTDLSVDVRNLQAVQSTILHNRPDLVFHLAAETDVDRCERDPGHAYLTNTIGTENLCLACQKDKIPLVYISTAGVFGGEKPEPYIEFDQPNPANIYGRSKWEGEKVVRNLLEHYFIFRAGWMVGGWSIDKKFVRKIVDQLKSKGEIKAVNDKFGSPTFTTDFARNVMRVVETGRYGLFHMTNKATCSRYDIALKIVEFMGVEGRVHVAPVSSAEFPLPALRARSEMLQNYKLELLGLNHMPPWDVSLKTYILQNMERL